MKKRFNDEQPINITMKRMKPILASLMCIFLTSPACADDRFERATDLAHRIILAEASAPICQPPVHAEQLKKNLVSALGSIGSPSLSDPAGLTLLHLAVLADDVPTMQRLANAGHALDIRDSHGGTLLHTAAHVGAQNALFWLLRQGADPNATNMSGATPMMVAVSQNRPAVVHALLAAGASAAIRMSADTTALHYAFLCRNPDIIRALLAAGAPVDEKARQLGMRYDIALDGHLAPAPSADTP